MEGLVESATGAATTSGHIAKLHLGIMTINAASSVAGMPARHGTK
jgi:hypothetical protein